MSTKTKAKVVLVGDSRVGKSSLLAAFAAEKFDATYAPTVGVNFKSRTVRIDDGDGYIGTVKLTVWDSAGEGQNYQAIQSTYYKGARCAVIVFDVTSRKSFENVERWMSEVAKYAEGPIPIVLVATKSDLWEERVVTAQNADEWAAEQSEVIPVHEVSSKDGSNIDELVDSIGGVIARSSVSRGSVSLARDTAAATAAPSMIRQQVQPPPVPVSSMPPQPRGEPVATESISGEVLRLERQQDELHLAIAEQQDVVARAKAAATEVAGRVGELESAFGSLQQNFEGVLQKIMAQQTENTQAVAALQQSATAHEQRAADEASAREKLSKESQARGQRDERALSCLRAELEELNAVLSRVREDVKCATENNQQTEGRLKAVEEVVTAQEQGSSSTRADTPPPVGHGDGTTDSAAIIAEIEKYVDTRISDSNHQQTAMLQKMEEMLKNELAELLQEGLSGCESRLGAAEEELAECHLESARHVQEARNAAKSCATEGVAKAVEQAAQLLNEEVRRLEAEWESRMADLATDFETAAMLGGSSSQSDAETDERVSQLSKELSAAKASLAVNKTELELQQGEIAVLTNRADSAEEENAELRARMDKLQSMLLAMGDSPFASPATMQAGGVSSTHGRRLEAGAAHATSSLPGESLGRGFGAADVSLRFDPSAMNRTTTDEIEADLMGTVNFNASYGDMSPMASPLVGADLHSSEFMLDSASSMPAFSPQVAQQQQQQQQQQQRQLGMEERPWPSQRRASQDLGQSTLAAGGGSGVTGDAAGSSPARRPRTAPPGWHEELERMLTEEKNESTAAMDAFAQNSQRRLSFRASKRRPVTPSDGTLRGYIRHCYDGCDDEPEMEQMREELRRMVEMFAAAGKIATTDWMTLPPPI